MREERLTVAADGFTPLVRRHVAAAANDRTRMTRSDWDGGL
jgi:hypothetical protein